MARPHAFGRPPREPREGMMSEIFLSIVFVLMAAAVIGSTIASVLLS
jgi:hypothetical protein